MPPKASTQALAVLEKSLDEAQAAALRLEGTKRVTVDLQTGIAR